MCNINLKKMKKYLLLMLVILTGISTSCKYDDDELWGSVEDVADRIASLETLTKQKNSDIAALQSILTALENQAAVSEVENLTDGCIIHFTDGSAVTIKNGRDGADGADGKDGENGKDGADGKDGANGADGEDGKDGADGKDGEDGQDGTDAPSIYVAKENGVYYWTITINGKTNWLTDELGRKLPVVGASAMDGVDGVNGIDGKDGIAPKVAVDAEGYWTVSENNGPYVRITDENGNYVMAKGKKGGEGEAGNYLFNSVTVIDGVVTITDENGADYQFPVLKAITYYSDAEGTNQLDNTKTIVVDGNYQAQVFFGLTLENAKYEVVADDQIADVTVSLPASTGELGNVNVVLKEGITVQEARVVVLFFSGKQTITAVLKFGSVAAWDGVSSLQATEIEEGVYAIAVPANLKWVAEQVNSGEKSFEGKTIRLMNDIDLNNLPWTPIGTSEYPFKGTLDGNGKVIKNMNVGTTAYARSRAASVTTGTGLFGVTENATIIDVSISNAQVNGEENTAAGVLVGVAKGETTITGVTIENGQAAASGSESAAGLVVGKATGTITVKEVKVKAAPASSEDETSGNKVEAAFTGGVVGYAAVDNIAVENADVSGLALAVTVTEGSESAAGAVFGKVEAATEGTEVTVAVSGATVSGVNVAVTGDTAVENASSVSVGALAGAVGNAANANIQISDNTISDVKTETGTEEAASNINQGTVLGNLNEVMESNPVAGAEILKGNEVSEDVEIKNQMKVESLNAMFEVLYNAEGAVPTYMALDIDGEISQNTTLQIPNPNKACTLDLNFKNLASSENAVFTISIPGGYNAGMEVNLNFNPETSGQYVELDMQNATVNLLSGQFANVKATTAANTLYIKDGVTVERLEIYQGNVRVSAGGYITGSITSYTNNLVYIILEEGATIANNLPAEEYIFGNIEITGTDNSVVIENVELSTALLGILGSEKVTLDENGFAVMLAVDVENTTVLNFNWRGYTISTLAGIEKFLNLEELYLNSVGLKECDFSQNPALRYIDVKWNTELTSLDFSNNPNLETLMADYCRNLTTLNLQGCEELTVLQLRRTALPELNVPNPAGIQYLSLADVAFAFDLSVYTGLTGLNISNLDFTSLDVIPDAVKGNLTELSCSGNQLTELDLSAYPNLVTLDCSNNQIQTIDLSAVPALVYLYCYSNHLEALDISALTELKTLICGNQYNNLMLVLTLTEDQKTLWKDSWKGNYNNSNVRLYDEIINNPETGTGGNGFGNGGKF